MFNLKTLAGWPTHTHLHSKGAGGGWPTHHLNPGGPFMRAFCA